MKQSLLADEQVADCPILLLGNKIDIPGKSLSLTHSQPLHHELTNVTGAAGEDEIRAAFGLHGQTTGKGKIPRKELSKRPMELFMCTVLKKQGYGEGQFRSPCLASLAFSYP